MFFGLESNLEPTLLSKVLPFFILGVFIALIIKYKELLKNWKYEKAFRFTWISLAVLLELWYWRWTYIYLSDGSLKVWALDHTMIPLHLCAISFWISMIVGATKNKTLFRLLVFIGILGPTITYVAGDVGYSFDHMRYWHYYIGHANIVWMIIYMWKVHEMKIFKGDWYKAITILFISSIFVLIINANLGTNFMYIYHAKGSPLDGLPWVLGYLILVAASVILFRLTELLFLKKA